MGASMPLPVVYATKVTVTVIDETGAPSRLSHELIGKLHYGAHSEEIAFTAITIEGGTGKQGSVSIPQRWFLPLPRLELSAKRLDGEGEWTRRSVRLVTGPMLWPAGVAQVVGALALLYFVLLFPQVKDLPTFVTPGAIVGVLGVFAVIAKWLRVRILGHLANPITAAGTAILFLGLSALVYGEATMVVNRSLDKLETSAGVLEPADYTVTFGNRCPDPPLCVPQDAGSECDSGGDCVLFDRPASVWLEPASHFVHRVDIGCTPLPILTTRMEFWKAQKQCLPIHPPPPVLAHLSPSEAFDQGDAGRTGDEVAVGFGWSKTAFELRKSSAYEVLHFVADAGADGGEVEMIHDDLQLRMSGMGGVREITASLGDHDVLTPAEGPDRNVLSAALLSSGLVVGDLRVRLGGASTLCELASTDQRLAELMLRRDDNVYRFNVTAPDFVRRFPICWPAGPRPGYGEIRLDTAWTPTLDWSLKVGDRMFPEFIAVLDGAGKALGQLVCPLPEATSDARWTVGPLRIDKSIGVLGEARVSAADPPMWIAAAGHETDSWIWACWRDTPPPRILGAHGLVATPFVEARSYHVAQPARACRCYQNGQELSSSDPCAEPLESPRALVWYQNGFGPADCDPPRSKLCAFPDGGKP
jgi:hypothetical protein